MAPGLTRVLGCFPLITTTLTDPSGLPSLMRPLVAQEPVQTKATVYAGKICKWPTQGARSLCHVTRPFYNMALTGGPLHQRTQGEEARSSVSHTVPITTGAFKPHRGSPQSYSSIRSVLTEHVRRALRTRSTQGWECTHYQQNIFTCINVTMYKDFKKGKEVRGDAAADKGACRQA